ncbi:hypothetical protein QBC43DRAFT_318457 [Cladorrhinum sp. PSN259]|nr:hypothetical protein QBC43DRAFT_318457 [Cladorrhinum sp. PSN259]
MKHSRIFAISALAAVAAAGTGEQKPLSRLTTLERTSSATAGAGSLFMSCEETYGEDWEVCGDANSSRFCFNPMMGQSCCAVDNGYCEEGTWCAPVAGYCCLDSEDLETCARNAGFVFPADLSKAKVPRPHQPWMAQTATSKPESVHFSLKRSEQPVDEIPRSTEAGSMQVRHSAAAGRERWALSWMGLGIGAVGLFMLSC